MENFSWENYEANNERSYSRSDPKAAGLQGEVWGCSPVFLLPSDGCGSDAPLVVRGSVDVMQLERDLVRAVSNRQDNCEQLHALSLWFEDQVAVSRVLQGCTGKLVVMRRKGLVHSDFSGRQALVERTNNTPKPAGSKTGGRPQPNHGYNKKRSAGKEGGKMEERIGEFRAPWFRQQQQHQTQFRGTKGVNTTGSKYPQ
ncbi:hypothetical protein N2152v2_004879 [Parachlorella kessleri]